MTPMIFNPSKKIAELLSSFLEFDPNQLQLGIWSGDLSIQGVGLRCEAMTPLLNKNTPDHDQRLQLKLVSGTIGNLRMRIPWKRLVWGQGDVQVDISDVRVVLAYESRQETKDRLAAVGQSQDQTEYDVLDGLVGETSRDLKQEWLRNAEQLLLQGLPVPSSFQTPKTNNSPENIPIEGDHNSMSLVDTWIKRTTGNFAWRFFAGLEASIRDIRIVLVQDGIEVGVINHAFNIRPKSTKNEDYAKERKVSSSPSSESKSTKPPSVSSLPVEYVGEFEDGEHVEKDIQLNGLGIFIRKIGRSPHTPSFTMNFSSSVLADDYLLRPSDLTVDFSFFYPFPPDKVKKKYKPIIDSKHQPIASNISLESSSPSTHRRGKRDKKSNISSATNATADCCDDFSESGLENSPNKKGRISLTSELQEGTFNRRSSQDLMAIRDTHPLDFQNFEEKSKNKVISKQIERQVEDLISPLCSKQMPQVNIDPLGSFDAPNTRGTSTTTPKTVKCKPELQQSTHQHGERSTSVDEMMSFRRPRECVVSDFPSVQSPAKIQDQMPHVDLHILFGAIKTVCSSKHYELVQLFLINILHLQNGRPDQTVGSVISENSPELTQSVYIDIDPVRPVKAQLPNGEQVYMPLTGTRLQLSLHLPHIQSVKRNIVRQWWKYACDNITRELAQRRRVKEIFMEKIKPFDWESQTYRRKEYVDLYIANRLGKSVYLHSVEVKTLSSVKRAEEILLCIEDELPTEQLLLYRAIARALRVRSMSTMPASVSHIRLGEIPSVQIKAGLSMREAATFCKGTQHRESSRSSAQIDVLNQDETSSLTYLQKMCGDVRNGVSPKGPPGNTSHMFSPTFCLPSTQSKMRPTKMNSQNKQAKSRSSSIHSKSIPNSVLGDFSEEAVRRAKEDETVGTHSCKTAKSSSTKHGHCDAAIINGKRMRISLSLKILSCELIVYKDETFSATANASGNSNSSLHGLKSALLVGTDLKNLVTDDFSSNDDISELSFLSGALDLDERIELKDTEEGDASHDLPILSSTDFLSYGMPRNVLLHVKVTGMHFSFQGSLGETRHLTMAVGKIVASGVNNCHIISLGSDQQTMNDVYRNPMRETRAYKTRRFTQRESSFAKGRFAFLDIPERALNVFVTECDNRKIMEINMAKICISLELETVVKLNDFITTSATWPKSVIPKSVYDDIRCYLQAHAQGIINDPMLMKHDISIGCHILGLEVNVPYTKLINDASIPHHDHPKVAHPSIDNCTLLMMTMQNIEYYDGLHIQHILSSSLDQPDDQSRYSDAKSKSFASTSGQANAEDGWVTDKTLELMDIQQLLDLHQSCSSHHAVITVKSFECYVQIPIEPKFGISRKTNLQQAPINLELLLTTHQSTEKMAGQPRHQLAVAISKLHFLMSDARLEVISQFLHLLSFVRSKICIPKNVGSELNKGGEEPPRLFDLAHQVQCSMNLSVTGLEITVMADSGVSCHTLTIVDKEIVLEESICDFLSFLACFDVCYPVKDAVLVAKQTCIDRLIAVGMTQIQALACIDMAQLHFLEDIQLMKKTQSHILHELSEYADFSNGILPDITQCDLDAMHGEILSAESNIGYEMDDEASDESADLIETAVQNAVENALQSFMHLLEQEENDSDNRRKKLAVLDFPHGIFISLTKLFYDMYIDVQIITVTLSTSGGIHILRLGETLLKDTDEVDDRRNEYTHSDADTHQDMISGIHLSFFLVVKGFNFGEGGLPLSVLGSDNVEFQQTTKETFQSISASNLEVFFAQKIISEVYNTLTCLFSTVQYKTRSSPNKNGSLSETECYKPHASESSLVFAISRASLLLASDDMHPFCSLVLNNCTGGNGLSVKQEFEVRESRFILDSDMVEVLNLGPDCQYFPEVISAVHPSGSLLQHTEKAHFRLMIVPSRDPWSQSDQIYIDLENVRVTILRQFINEVIQFTSSDSYGIGLFLNKRTKSQGLDLNKNPPQALQFEISIKNASVLVPRSSISVDMLAVEVGKIVIMNKFPTKSFTVPSVSTPLEKNEGKVAWKSSSRYESPRARCSTDAYFFDCVDDQEEHSREDLEESMIDNCLIQRIEVRIENARLFTSLTKKKFERSTCNGTLLRHLCQLNGRASNHKLVYMYRTFAENMDTSLLKGIVDRYWEEISIKPVYLEILADYAPHLRILISDRFDDSIIGSSIQLDLRISQFYLLLSIWYGNMQELPILFPFSTSQVISSATSPKPPPLFPEYGSMEFIDWLKGVDSIRSELACSFEDITLLCSFDKPGYFESDPDCLPLLSRLNNHGIDGTNLAVLNLRICNPVLHLTNDLNGIMRIGVGASGFNLSDERRNGVFKTVVNASKPNFDKEYNVPDLTDDSRVDKGSWADLSWGLDCDATTLTSELPLPLQVSVFMTPGWVLTNVGIDSVDATIFDFTPIWIILDYFSLYFSNGAFGNPLFEAEKDRENSKAKLNAPLNNSKMVDQRGVNMDFRLWLTRPHLCIPSSSLYQNATSLRIDCETGFWYHYKSLGSFSSQEMCSTNFGFSVANEFETPGNSRLNHFTGSPFCVGTKNLINGLSFGFRMDSNAMTEHTDYTLRIPFPGQHRDGELSLCSIVSREIEVDSVELHPPTVCAPIQQQVRSLGPTICEITLVINALPVAAGLLLTFLSGSIDANETKSNVKSLTVKSETSKAGFSFSANTSISGLRIFAIDPVLGLHLPIAVCCVSSVKINASQMCVDAKVQSFAQHEAPPADLQLALELNFWADYFKLGVTRSWEPLLEPYSCLVLLEKSKRRGQGISLNSESPFHVNVSGSLLLLVDEAITSFSRAFAESFGSTKPITQYKVPHMSQYAGTYVDQDVNSFASNPLHVQHHVPKPLKPDDRVAFSVLNLTGQRIRIYQQTREKDSLKQKVTAVVTYLRHTESTRLEFEATVSVNCNLQLVDVPFPGLPQSRRNSRRQGSMEPTINVQVPGFRWIQGMSVDTSGRKFDELEPRSVAVLAKMHNDWRLQNALKVLTEVGIENGGRLVTVRTLFEIRNKTTHSIWLALHPDPTHNPIAHQGIASQNLDYKPESVTHLQAQFDVFETIDAGESYQVPTLLLESALHLKGSHLGCFWISPANKDSNQHLFKSIFGGVEHNVNKMTIGYCSRPVQLAKVVHETSQIFLAASGEDIAPEKARSGTQVSCPISDGSDGAPLAPFCYAVEIRRSPVVKLVEGDEKLDDQPRVNFALQRLQLMKDSAPSNISNTGFPKKTRRNEVNASSRYKHGPVTYSLSIHPPLVIENLLPTRGRFELMHASRRIVLWFSDLEPGERIPIHTVGLDAPLLLLVNLGFSRTPVGEGALIHHGADTKGSSGTQGGLKSFGKAVSKGTKQIGKTLTAISDSPVKRGKGLIVGLQSPDFHSSIRRSTFKKNVTSAFSSGGIMGLDTGDPGDHEGKVHSVSSVTYSLDDIATETTVIDSIGQRLTLGIDNSRGGGGQRRISMFCPFWIVNTTEHALRYKQDKSSTYVSGTVVNPVMDGSKAVDGSNRNTYGSPILISQRFGSKKKKYVGKVLSTSKTTIFAGKPGALATYPGICDLPAASLTPLLEKDLPLDKLASLAFMFSFQDTLAIGHSKMAVQLADGTHSEGYTSDWSQGFSLDSVGVLQVVGMHCKDGRVLEVSVTISVAPGFLSGYTKIVRFTPRFILVNQLERPLRLWQDSSLLHSIYDDRSNQQLDSTKQKSKEKWKTRGSDDGIEKVSNYEVLFTRPTLLDEVDGISTATTAHHSALYITTVLGRSLTPFHLPDTRGDRQFRIDLGGNWNLSPSFNADVTGEHTIRILKAVDLRLLQHVNTRASPHYKVILPPSDGDLKWDGELGVWFETDWGGNKKVIVKGTKRKRYSFSHTDIHTGDELLRIDKVNVSNMTFTETMKLLKERVAYVSSAKKATELNVSLQGKEFVPQHNRMLQHILTKEDPADVEGDQLVLTFRTLEERLRRLRVNAAKARRNSGGSQSKGKWRRRPSILMPTGQIKNVQNTTITIDNYVDLGDLKVEMRNIQSSMFVVVREQDEDTSPYRIENRAMNHVTFFRQRGCCGHPWNILKPGETKTYTWEEPMKPKKLSVKIGSNNISLWDDEGTIDVHGIHDFHNNSDAEPDIKGGRAARFKQILSAHFVNSEERASFGAIRTVQLEEIGFQDVLPFPNIREAMRMNSAQDSNQFLRCQVDTDGATRVLIISDNKGTDERSVMQKHVSTIERQIRNEEQRRERFIYLKILTKNDEISNDEEKTEEIPGTTSTFESCQLKSCHTSKLACTGNKHEVNSRRCALKYSVIEDEALVLADFPESSTIHRRNQIIVEILEATGLKPNEVTGVCNPYCEIVVKGRSKTKRSLFSQNKIKKRTYYIEKNLAPKWSDQVFIFDLPEDTANITRGHSVQFRLRNFKFVGSHPHLGQTNVHLSSLRNQQELVGWYPLVGRTGRRELEDTQVNWGRGSVKLRVQWIYTVPALLDYFLTISERRLYDLCSSLAGMNQQLEHLIESEKTMNGLQDPFSVGRIPNLLGIRTPTKQMQQLQQGLSRIKSDSSDNTKRPKLSMAAMNGPLRQSRGRLMWLLYFQTAESKRSRRMGDSKIDGAVTQNVVPQLARDPLASIAEVNNLENMVAGDASPGVGPMHVTDSNLGCSLTTLKNASIEELYCSSMLDHLSRSSRNGNRVRSYSLGDIHNDTNVSLESFNISTRDRTCTFDGICEEQCGIFENSASYLAAQSADTVQRTECVNKLFLEGLVYHRSNEYFHKRHLSYRFRASLLETKKGTTLSMFQPKSLHRLSASTKQLRSWIVAQGILNDVDLLWEVQNSQFHLSLVQTSDPDVGKLDNNIDDSDTYKDKHLVQDSCKSFVLRKLVLPHFAPNKMKQHALARAEGVYLFRNQFERACKRSLQAVLNPGGWLTIRPITALNLTESFTGMHVKLRYGSEVVINQTVDARVTPCWTFEEDQSTDLPNKHPVVATSIISTSSHHTSPEFQLKENDLQVYVEPQKTSGSLRLSVVGERLNLKTELGVLHIPLGSAISCCVESIEDSRDIQQSLITPFPMYTRWFPLMSPNDSVPVDGDMGYSYKPEETEQLRDSMFTNYFTPCIKLAFIWQPNQQEVMEQGDSLRGRDKFSSIVAGENRYDELDSPLTENYFNADIARVSFSLIDSQRALELLTLALCDIDIRFSVTKAKTRFGFVIGWIQVDHQDPLAREPVVLAPTPVEHPQPTLQFLAVKDNLRSKGNVLSYEYIGVSLQELDLTIEEAWMFGVWEFIVSVIRRREGKRKVNGVADLTDEKLRDRPSLLSTTTQFRSGSCKALNFEENSQSSLFAILLGENTSGELLKDDKVYVEQLLLGFVKVNLSYSKGKRGRWELTEGGDFITKSIDGLTQGLPEKMAITAGGLRVVGGRRRQVHSDVLAKWASHTHDEDLWTDSGSAKSTYNLPNIIAAIVPSVSDAPIRLQGKAIEHIFESSSEIFDSIKNYYVNETLKQIYKIVGSLDFVGNPTMVLNSFATGVKDFFVTPSQAFLRTPNNPSSVGIGVAKGTLSLLSHSTSGLFGFAAKMAATAGQAAASLSFDAEYQRWHRDMIVAEAKSLDRQYKKRGLQSIEDMVTRPIWDIVRGTALGVSGLFSSPYKGALKEGGSGFVKGVVLGVVGVITKPTVGVLDALTHFVGSIHDVAKSVNVLEKRYQPARKLRLPSFFGLQDVLAPFDLTTARSVTLLRLYPMKTKRSSQEIKGKYQQMREIHVASEVLNMEPGIATFVIVSSQRVILCKVKKESAGILVPTLCWEVNLYTDLIVTPSVQEHGHNGVALTIMTIDVSSDKIVDLQPTIIDSGNTPMSRSRSDDPISTQQDISEHRSISGEELGSNFISPLHTVTTSRYQSQRIQAARGKPRFDRSSSTKLSQVSRSSSTCPALLGIEPVQNVLWATENAELCTAREGELQLENHSHGTRQSLRGEILDWYTILAEFQHRRQLSRIHNAICCVTGNLDAIILDKGLGSERKTEGYTSFGDLTFTPEIATTPSIRIDEEIAVLQRLEKTPWVYESSFKQYSSFGSKETAAKFVEERRKWTKQQEIDASLAGGGPLWLVKARSEALFIPEEFTDLPNTPVTRSAAAKAVLADLERGTICYTEAVELIDGLNRRCLAVMHEDSANASNALNGTGKVIDVQIVEEPISHIQFDAFASTRMEITVSDDISLVSSQHLSHVESVLTVPTYQSNAMKDDNASCSAQAIDSDSCQPNDTQVVSKVSSAIETCFVEYLSIDTSTVASKPYHFSFDGSFDHKAMDMRQGVDRESKQTMDDFASEKRLEKVEAMLEKLLEITILQSELGQKISSSQQPVASGNVETAILRQELEQLRQEINAKKELECSMGAMNAEIQFLKSALNDHGIQSQQACAPVSARKEPRDGKLTEDQAMSLARRIDRPFRKGAAMLIDFGKALKDTASGVGKRVTGLNQEGEEIQTIPVSGLHSTKSNLEEDVFVPGIVPIVSLSKSSTLQHNDAPSIASSTEVCVERIVESNHLMDDDSIEALKS